MSYGKYSPNQPAEFWKDNNPESFCLNAKGEPPAEWTPEMAAAGATYDPETMFADYNKDGYDYYGYSAYDTNGVFVGSGRGVDNKGMTEMDHLLSTFDNED